MQNTDMVDLPDLIKRANKSRVKLSVSNDNLVVNFPTGEAPDEGLMSLLKINKERLKKYLKEHFSFDNNRIHAKPDLTAANGTELYKATSVQNYWLDDSLDSEFKKYDTIHGTSLSVFDIDGFFDLAIFSRSVQLLIQRHESLRAYFVRVDGHFYMGVDNAPSEDKYINILSEDEISNNSQIEHFANFEDHRFDPSTGPLFLVRICCKSPNNWILSIKIHHVICDGYSYDVILRDLFRYYQQYVKGGALTILPLKAQLKDFMAMENDYVKENSLADERYWLSRFDSLPPELFIPGSSMKKSKIFEQVFDAQRYEFSSQLAHKVTELAGKKNVNAFVIIQAALGSFLFRQGNPGDFCFGTYVLGRDFQGMEQQVGCFANTKLIRFSFEQQSSYEDVIDAVAKANEDMARHRATTLREILERMGPAGFPERCAFWNINVQFAYAKKEPAVREDGNDRIVDIGFNITKRKPKPHSLIAIDMQLQFTSSPDTLHVDAQFDGSRHSKESILSFLTDFEKYFSALSISSDVGTGIEEFSHMYPNQRF
ncbi:condensation domain-containing protein [Dyadobacter sp. OTU695]|uniref:condensation domain-containing protein n=1 Tax=Dyadobacter sp. OTU695 TaxID=3043860 RepID=UPI00313D7252